METPLRTPEQQEDNPGQNGAEPNPKWGDRSNQDVAEEERLGEQLIREARESHADLVAGWRRFLEELGIQGEPVGAKKLREMLVEEGIDPNDNSFSRAIIAAREEEG